MVISKGSYGHGEFRNVLPLSVQIPYLPVRDRKLHRFMGGSIGPRIGTAFAPKQWLYQKKGTGMESS